MKNYRFGFCGGWFKGNPFVLFRVELFSAMEDYPKGWASITLMGLYIGKLEVTVSLNKK